VRFLVSASAAVYYSPSKAILMAIPQITKEVNLNRVIASHKQFFVFVFGFFMQASKQASKEREMN